MLKIMKSFKTRLSTDKKSLTFKQQIGQAAEMQACHYLQQQGLRLIQTNFRCKLGEIDLIMQDKNCLVFVEVRFKRSAKFGTAAESITPFKQLKLTRAAYFYLQQQKLFNKVNCRFDFVAVGDHIDWIKNAFSA